jgi:hypothetical protein
MMPSLKIARFLFVFAIDVAAGILLLLSLHGDIRKPEAWRLHPFTSNTADLLFYTALRFCTLVIFGWVAVWVGTVKSDQQSHPEESGAITEPLLSKERRDPLPPTQPATHEAECCRHKLPMGGAAASEASASLDKKDPQALRAAMQTSANTRRNSVVLVLFFFCTAAQILVGAKAVSLHYNSAEVQGPLLGAMVLCINMEIWMLHGIVKASTMQTGKQFASHKHPLLFMPNVAAAGGLGRRGDGGWHIRCSECSNRLRSAHGCVKCQYFLCQVCEKRMSEKQVTKTVAIQKGNENKRGEDDTKQGQSGDRKAGKRKETEDQKVREKKGQEVSATNIASPLKSATNSYFRRAVMLVIPHWRVLVGATVCLLVSVATQVLLPNFQGKILDAVIQKHEAHFHTLMTQFILLSLLTGLTGGLRRLLFNVMGRQISYTVRNQVLHPYSGLYFRDPAHSCLLLAPPIFLCSSLPAS